MNSLTLLNISEHIEDEIIEEAIEKADEDIGEYSDRYFMLVELSHKVEVKLRDRLRKLEEIVYSMRYVDQEKRCPFCEKDGWGWDLHAEGCPFHDCYWLCGDWMGEDYVQGTLP